MNDLKRCPFCGSKAQLLIVPGRVAHWVVRCSKGCCNTCQHISDHDAEEMWNKRTAEEHLEIVQCKDCKYGEPCNEGDIFCINDIGTIQSSVHRRKWYCADGKRKESR